MKSKVQGQPGGRAPTYNPAPCCCILSSTPGWMRWPWHQDTSHEPGKGGTPGTPTPGTLTPPFYVFHPKPHRSERAVTEQGNSPLRLYSLHRNQSQLNHSKTRTASERGSAACCGHRLCSSWCSAMLVVISHLLPSFLVPFLPFSALICGHSRPQPPVHPLQSAVRLHYTL